MDLNTHGDQSLKSGSSNYDEVTPLQWVEYEFATIEYDYQIHPKAAESIRYLFKRLANGY